MRVITQAEVPGLLSMASCIEVMERTFRALAGGQVEQPLRTGLPVREHGLFLAMPAALPRIGAFGLKAIAVLPENEGTAWDSHQGVVVLFGPGPQALVAVIEASSLTAIRTAAVSGLATRLLARADAGDLAMIGTGVEARTHLEAMAAVRPLRRIRVWRRSPRRCEEYAAWARGVVSVPVEVAPSAEAAVREADLVCLVTSATVPVVQGEWFSPGAHLNAVGAHRPDSRETDSDTVARARVFVDSRAAALAEAGDLMIPIEEGRITAGHIVGELGDLVTGRMPGRQDDAEITLFKSLGLAVEDIAAAHAVWQRAEEVGAGSVIDLAGTRDGQ
ncbi:MAG: ornithine cyclodeaminase family protein [Gemmatimonadota bacterium]